jgi:hypothetical protein
MLVDHPEPAQPAQVQQDHQDVQMADVVPPPSASLEQTQSTDSAPQGPEAQPEESQHPPEATPIEPVAEPEPEQVERYLPPAELAEKLAATLPDPLSKMKVPEKGTILSYLSILLAADSMIQTDWAQRQVFFRYL